MDATQHMHKSTRLISRPANEVFDYLLDLSNIKQWNPIVLDVEDERGPLQGRATRGTRVHARVQVFGVEMRTTSEVLDIDEEQRRLRVRVEFPRGGTITGQLEVQELAEGSAIHFEQQVAIPGWLTDRGIASEAVMIGIDQAVKAGLARVQEILNRRHEAILKQVQLDLSS
jgi:uncharacterized protein YndB with AHSA1/START domain